MTTRYAALLALALAVPGAARAQQITLNASDDAYVQSSAAAETKGTTDAPRLWVRSSTSVTRLTYLKFNVGTITAATRAVLRITVDAALLSTAGSAFRTDVVTAASDTWTENTVTFTNAPAAGTAPIASQEFTAQAAADPDQTYDIDVTAYVLGQVSGDKVVTLVLRDLASTTDVRFHSKENVAGATGPQLIVTGTGTANEDDARARGFSARLVGANPARGAAQLAVDLDAPGALTAVVYDALGRRVATLADEMAGAGTRTLAWDRANAAPGTYFVRIVLDGRAQTLALTLVR